MFGSTKQWDPNVFYGPTGSDGSESQAFTFLIRDKGLVPTLLPPKDHAPTGLGKYLMRSPSGEIILGDQTMRFWD